LNLKKLYCRLKIKSRGSEIIKMMECLIFMPGSAAKGLFLENGWFLPYND